uniref:RRM domain-containing protein n=1 Tax=Strongyloides papillosus TaxID=174720 RepID=A0A0N5C4M4_STREA
MVTEDRDYRRRSDSYSHRDYSRSRDDRHDRDGDRYRRYNGDRYDDSRSADRYRDSRNPDRERSSERRRSTRDYDYSSRDDRYDDRSSSRRRDDRRDDERYSRSSRYDECRSSDRYSDRRSPDRSDRYSSSRRSGGTRFSDDRTPRGAFRGRGAPRGRGGRGGGRGNAVTLHSVVLENLNENCSSVDLMRYGLENAGMPDVADVLGNGVGIIGYHDRSKFEEVKNILRKENKIPLLNGGFSTLTVGREQS